MNSLGEIIPSPEGGWLSLQSSNHPAICRSTVAASGNGWTRAAEAFIKTFKRDYAKAQARKPSLQLVSPLKDASQ
jgi:hypothetical protein